MSMLVSANGDWGSLLGFICECPTNRHCPASHYAKICRVNYANFCLLRNLLHSWKMPLSYNSGISYIGTIIALTSSETEAAHSCSGVLRCMSERSSEYSRQSAFHSTSLSKGQKAATGKHVRKRHTQGSGARD